MKKTLVLIDNLYEQYGLQGNEDVISFLPLMKNSNSSKFIRAIRRLHLSSIFPFKKIWFNKKWQQIVNNYNTIILGDTGSVHNVVNFINKQYKDKRIIIWYRNSVEKTILPSKLNRNKCELWSFDFNDCKKYNMKYNPQFYMYNNNYQINEIQYDAFFVGQDKGRTEKLLLLEKELQLHNYKTKFCIVGYNTSRIPYDKVLNYISKTKIIVDFQCDWQEGITLRPLESLFYKKKLITNNKNIVNFDFYNKNNIFIIGQDDFDSLNEFVSTDYVDIEDKIIENYTFEKWVQRFNDGGENK